jgi:hypothetical protein
MGLVTNNFHLGNSAFMTRNLRSFGWLHGHHAFPRRVDAQQRTHAPLNGLAYTCSLRPRQGVADHVKLGAVSLKHERMRMFLIE